MKIQEKEEARKLRKEDGLSIMDISKKLGVSKSSVSLWVRDIQLSDIQMIKLQEKKPGSYKGAKAVKNKFKEFRIQCQDNGRKRIINNDILFIAGCMLYWGEGAKSKNQVCLANSDPNLMKFYMKFLRESLKVLNSEITIHINCYTDVKSLNEIQNYWLNILDLPISCLGKSTVNNLSNYSKQKRCGKLVYGTCRVVVSRTDLVQSIYGGIQELASFYDDKWLG